MTQITSDAVKFGKIHFITKYFDARWGFLIRVLLHGKPYLCHEENKQTWRNFCVSLGELQPCMVSFYRKLDSREATLFNLLERNI